MEPMPVVLVAADNDELLEVVDEFAGDEVIEEFGPFVFLGFPEYCNVAEHAFVTLLADRSNTDIRLLGLNLGVPLNGTTNRNSFVSLCLTL